MHLREIDFAGYFEEQTVSSSEKLQIVAPDDDLEKDVLAWTLLPVGETVENDAAREGYVFHYELGEEVDRGLFTLKLSATDASGVDHAVEIAAAVVTAMPSEPPRVRTFKRFWMLSESLHFKPIENITRDQYHGAAYGQLRFDESGVLPHRRLFGATI